MQFRPAKGMGGYDKKAPAKDGGQGESVDSLFEFSDFAFAVHVAVAVDFLAADFPVKAQPILLDVAQRGVAFIDALLLSGTQVDEGVGHGHVKLLDHTHFAGFSPCGGQA